MSPQYSIFLLLVFVVLATATNIPLPPAETLKSLTGPPASVITPAPSDVDLQKRIIATCGFVRGDSASPITCPGGYNCVATMKAALQFACCNNVECLGNYGICRQYGEKGCMGYTFGDDTCESIYGSILQCSEESPYCFRYALSSSRGATNTYYSLGCATTSEDVLLLDSATNAAVKTKAADSTQQGGVANPLTSLYSIPGMASPPEPTFGSSSSNPPTGNPGKSILSTTAIVAISVVGACVLLVALLFIWCCWRRSSRRNTERIRPKIVEPAYAPTVTQGPGPGSIFAWNDQTPLGSNPEIAPSETASQWSGPTATAQRRPMNTVYEY